MDDGITYAKPRLWDAGVWVRLRALALSLRLEIRCARKGHEWRTERPTRCVSVTACRVCGAYIGTSTNRDNPESPCLWFRPSMVSRPPTTEERNAAH